MSSRPSAELKTADTQAASGEETPGKLAKDKKRRRSSGGQDDVSRVLRGVYDDTLREDVPDDFMDLLGKLS